MDMPFNIQIFRDPENNIWKAALNDDPSFYLESGTVEDLMEECRKTVPGLIQAERKDLDYFPESYTFSHRDSDSIPHYDRMKKCWAVKVDGRTETGDILYVVGEYIHDNLFFPFECQERTDGFQDHEHRFEDVLVALLASPESFSIKGFEDYYSSQEIRLLDKLKEKLLSEKRTLS